MSPDTVLCVYPVLDVSRWRRDEVDEQLGTKEKSWLRDVGDERWLFKEVRSSGGRIRGEDWAEKVVEQLGRLLGLPMATVELAIWAGQRGIVTRNFVPDGARLEHGNELLVRVDPDYDRDVARQNDRYTIDAVSKALAEVRAPGAYDREGLTAFDVWAGYLVLDAWVAGRDRHHENWGVIAGRRARVLAPSFDHGNALGFQEADLRCRRMVTDPSRLLIWAERGTSHHFAGGPTLVQLVSRVVSH